jgi:hypothetical protein
MNLSINHSWVNGIEVSSKKGPDSLERGGGDTYNHKNVKIGWGSFKELLE